MNTPESIVMGRSRMLGARTTFAALQILSQQEGGSMRIKELKDAVYNRIGSGFDDWEAYQYPDGSYRWIVNFHMYSLGCVKAGYLIKDKGVWCITDEGREALEKYNSPTKLYQVAHAAYNEWYKKNKGQELPDEPQEDASATHIGMMLSEIRQKSDDDLHTYMEQRTPYEFQDLVAALLRAMGYYTPFVAPKGKDGGVDVIAYSDPLGAKQPILKVQVKHYNINNPVGVEVIHNIIGVSKGDVPVVVTSGRFTEEAQRTARTNNVRLIDGTEFIELWIKLYAKMDEDDKLLMPIEPVYFIKRTE